MWYERTKIFCVLSPSKIFHHFLGSRFPMLLIVSCSLPSMVLNAQYPPKMSTTGPEAAEARGVGKRKLGKHVLDEGKSPIKLGPLNFSVGASLTEQFNDNIALSENDPKMDIITSPGINIGITTDITPLNYFSANIQLGYQKYLFHPELDADLNEHGIVMSPLSDIQFVMYSSGVILTLYDRPSIQSDPVTIPQLSNLNRFRRFNNDLGLTAECDLNSIFLSGTYNHNTFKSFEDQFTFLNHETDSVGLTVGYRVSPKLTVGSLTTYSITGYDDKIQNDSTSMTTGFFANTLLTEYLSANASLSFQGSSFDRGGSIGDASDFSSVVYGFGLQNQLNRWLSHSVTYSKFTTLGIGSNFTEINMVSYTASLMEVLKGITTTFVLTYQDLSDSASISAEKSSVLSLGPTFVYKPNPNWNFSLEYRFHQKDSQRVGSSYDQNVVSFLVNYSFL